MNLPKLLIDENLSPTVAVALQRDGVDVVHVRDRAMNGSSDVDVFACAFNEDRIVVTLNVVDFSCSRTGARCTPVSSLSSPRASPALSSCSLFNKRGRSSSPSTKPAGTW